MKSLFLFVLIVILAQKWSEVQGQKWGSCGGVCESNANCTGGCGSCVATQYDFKVCAQAISATPTKKNNNNKWLSFTVANATSNPNSIVLDFNAPKTDGKSATTLELWYNTSSNQCALAFQVQSIFDASLYPLTNASLLAPGYLFTNIQRDNTLADGSAIVNFFAWDTGIQGGCAMDVKYRVKVATWPTGNVNLDGKINTFEGTPGSLVTLTVNGSSLLSGATPFTVQVSGQDCEAAVIEQWSTLDKAPIQNYGGSITSPVRVLGSAMALQPSEYQLLVFVTNSSGPTCELNVNASLVPQLNVTEWTLWEGNTSYGFLRSSEDDAIVSGYSLLAMPQSDGCMTMQFSGTGSICDVHVNGSEYKMFDLLPVQAGTQFRMDFMQVPGLWYCAGYLQIVSCSNDAAAKNVRSVATHGNAAGTVALH